MSVDVRIQPLAFDAQATPEEARQAGINAEVLLSVTAGLILPFSTDGTTPAVVPLGNIRFGLPKEAAVEIAKKILEEAEKLPDASDLVVANSERDIEAVARTLGQTGG